MCAKEVHLSGHHILMFMWAELCRIYGLLNLELFLRITFPLFLSWRTAVLNDPLIHPVSCHREDCYQSHRCCHDTETTRISPVDDRKWWIWSSYCMYCCLRHQPHLACIGQPKCLSPWKVFTTHIAINRMSGLLALNIGKYGGEGPCLWVPVTTSWRVLRLRMEERPLIWRVAANKLNKQ